MEKIPGLNLNNRPTTITQDENVEATVVGIGIEREQKGCKTNEKGPEVN